MNEAEKKQIAVEQAMKAMSLKALGVPPNRKDLLINKLENLKCPTHMYKNKTTKELTGVISFWKRESNNYWAAKDRKNKSQSLPIKVHHQFEKDLLNHQRDEQVTR